MLRGQESHSAASDKRLEAAAARCRRAKGYLNILWQQLRKSESMISPAN